MHQLLLLQHAATLYGEYRGKKREEWRERDEEVNQTGDERDRTGYEVPRSGYCWPLRCWRREFATANAVPWRRSRMRNPQLPKKRAAFVLIDGLSDVSLPRFGYNTPLQAAKIPNFDAIASAGVNGLMDPVEVGLACGSDTAHLSLLAYDPRVYYRGRGAFESMGAGLAMSPGDIAFKSNFATLDEKTGIVTSKLTGTLKKKSPYFVPPLMG